MRNLFIMVIEMPEEAITLICQWCGGNTLPFHKLNVHMYGNHRFICETCYKELEEQQSLYNKMFSE